MKPHKHAELIKAWADGIEVEYRLNDGVKGWSEWKTLAHDRPFLSDSWWEYRIKPIPDRIEEITVFKNMAVDLIDYVYKDTHWLKNPNHYSPIGNMRVTFDGETGKLKSAEVI